MYYLLRSTSEGLIVLFSLVYFLNYHFYLEEDFGLYNPDELVFKQLFIKKYNPTWWEIWETHWMIVWDFGGFPGDAGGKESTCQSRRCKRLGLSPRGAHGNPLQYSCLENPVDRRAWRATSMGSQRVGQCWSDLAGTHTRLRLFTSVGMNLSFFSCFVSYCSRPYLFKL